MTDTNELLLKEPVPLMKSPDFLDYWIKNSIEIDREVTTRLTGDGSLYDAYVKACQKQKQPPPMSLRAFTKRLEAFFEWHFKTPITKTRDQKGMRYPGVKLKPANSNASPLVSRSGRETREDQLIDTSPTSGK